jgi:hypothetical protein
MRSKKHSSFSNEAHTKLNVLKRANEVFSKKQYVLKRMSKSERRILSQHLTFFGGSFYFIKFRVKFCTRFLALDKFNYDGGNVFLSMR